MHIYQVIGCFSSILFIACVWAAPVSEIANKGEQKRSVNQDQEKQLESLLNLAAKNVKVPNVAVHKSHVTHVENTNGQEIKHEEVEEKVTNTETGEIVSDVQQDITQSKSPSNNEPHTVVETKVDIPSEGVHKTIIQNSPKDDAKEANDESIEFTPTAVAEYLLETGEFENFYSALQDLVNSSVMTEAEAENYQQEVMGEYQRLLAEIDAYQSELAQQDAMPSYYQQPVYPPLIPQKKSSLYKYGDVYPAAYNPEDLSLENQQVVQDALMNNQKSLSAAIDALLEAWWNQAFEAGDARAQALVEYLYNIVSKDDDMDDIGQIREILAEMLARALMEDMAEGEGVQEVESSEEDKSSASSQEESSESEESSEEESSKQEESSEEGSDSVESSSEEKSSEEASEPEAETEPEQVVDKTAKM